MSFTLGQNQGLLVQGKVSEVSLPGTHDAPKIKMLVCDTGQGFILWLL